MKKIIFFGLLLFSITNAQDSLKNIIYSINDLNNAVAYLKCTYIETQVIDGKEYEVWLKNLKDKKIEPKTFSITGTGIFVQSKKNLYLITASHVAKSMNNNTDVFFRGEYDLPLTLKLNDITNNGSLKWLHNDSADVAIIQLMMNERTLKNYFQKRFLPIECIVDSLIAPTRETLLTAIGFPLGLGTDKYFSPLTLQTHASSGLLELRRSDNKRLSTFFVCENPSIGGYSGAPIVDLSIYKMGSMVTTGSGTRLVGIMHGTISDETGGKLSAIVPSKFIIDLIKKYEYK